MIFEVIHFETFSVTWFITLVISKKCLSKLLLCILLSAVRLRTSKTGYSLYRFVAGKIRKSTMVLQYPLLQDQIEVNLILQKCHVTAWVCGQIKDGIDDLKAPLVINESKIGVLCPPPLSSFLIVVNKKIGTTSILKIREKIIISKYFCEYTAIQYSLPTITYTQFDTHARSPRNSLKPREQIINSKFL